MFVRRTLVSLAVLVCSTPALAQTDFACKPGSCNHYDGAGRSCSDLTLMCQGNCTNGKNTFNSAPEYCTKMCGGAHAKCLKTGTWSGIEIINNLRRQ